MPIALVATTGSDGTANLAPYSLLFPQVTADGHHLVLVTRTASKTAANMRRNGLVSLNFLTDTPEHMAALKALSAPVDSAVKMASHPFRLQPSTRPAAADGTVAPPIVGEAVQVFEARVLEHEEGVDGAEQRFVLEVEQVLMPPRWADALERGGRGPRLMVDYGFRRASESWLSRPRVVASGPRLRPSFVVDLPRSPERVVADFTAALSHPDAPVIGKIRGEAIQIGMPPSEVRTFSPSMDIRVEAKDDGTRVYGRIGPQPQVWTTFMFFHMIVAMFGVAGLMWGLARLTANESGWPLWFVPVALFLHAFIAGGAFIGQGLSADQMHRMRSFVDDIIEP
jgi:flavin reductase (DIM6/NTAB) family NADH-FMN oxidoreductase RutF